MPFPPRPIFFQALNELKEAGEVDQVHEWVNEQGRIQRRLKKVRPGPGIVGPSGEEFCGLATGSHSIIYISFILFTPSILVLSLDLARSHDFPIVLRAPDCLSLNSD